MRAIVDITVDCTITDELRLMELARTEVDAAKPPDDRSLYYPTNPTEAIQLLIRSAIATALQSSESVTLHQIGHQIKFDT